MRLILLCLAGILTLACETQVADPRAPTDPLAYRIDYQIVPDPAQGTARVTMRVAQARQLLRELRFRAGDHLSDMTASGKMVHEGSEVTWILPERGGEMSWKVAIPHRRNSGGFDAWLGPDFGLFRAEDIIPRAASRSLKGAHSETSMSFRLPVGWSAVTQYFDDQGRFRIDNPERRLDLPTGWIVMGELGVRRERIAGVRVAIAGPTGHAIRRLDIIALLNWTLPELARILPELPNRLTIVSAGDPMWRGGLSAPQSLYVHAERPLISENGTSTLLHEVMHLSLGFGAADGYDWIVEGIAEYYSLQLLRRSGTISNSRYDDAIADLKAWAGEAETLCARNSTGARTALAVGVFAALDAELRAASRNKVSLDDVAATLWNSGKKVDADTLRSVVAELIGTKPDALHSDKLRGCRSIDPKSA